MDSDSYFPSLSPRPDPHDTRSKTHWGKRDELDIRMEEIDFNNERLVLRRTAPTLQHVLQLSLWKATSTEDTLVAILLVDIRDQHLQTFQTWLMRNIHVRAVSIFAISVGFTALQSSNSVCFRNVLLDESFIDELDLPPYHVAFFRENLYPH